jgi:hypothetical protein
MMYILLRLYHLGFLSLFSLYFLSIPLDISEVNSILQNAQNEMDVVPAIILLKNPIRSGELQ